MHFLTWQGTLVCTSCENGTLASQCLPLQQPTFEALDVEISNSSWHKAVQHPLLGQIKLTSSDEVDFVQIYLNGDKIFAHPSDGKINSLPGSPEKSDLFLAITSRQLEDLNFILNHYWFVCSDRRVSRRDAASLGVGSKLRFGTITVDLPVSSEKLVGARSRQGSPVRLSGYNFGEKFEILLSEPSNSSLLRPMEFVQQFHRVPEIPAIVAYRQVFGLEPTKDMFERGASLLPSNSGASRHVNSLNGWRPEISNRSPIHRKNDQGSQLATSSEGWATCPVVSIGIGCLVACALKGMDGNRAPFPFDWLTTTPAMVRHCIENNFELLLDRSQYVSLTGQQEFGQPENGCDHSFYKEKFGVQRVFNHSDPTRKTDYRYLTACVDRMRGLLDSDGPKLFVQCTKSNADSMQDFCETANLIDAFTTNASYLYLQIEGADRRLTVPQLSLVKRKGRHQLFYIQPTSKMGGEYFDAEVDNIFFRWLISLHSDTSSTYLSRIDTIHSRIQAAFSNFDKGMPIPAEAQLQSSIPNVLRWVNSVVTNFCRNSKLYINVEIGAFESENLGTEACQSVCLAQTNGDNVLILFPGHRALSRVAVNRLLTLIYLFDSMLSDGSIPPARFLIELGDYASSECVSFCSNINKGCLVPDSDFISSSGYSETRIMVQREGHVWSERSPVLFWRGSTTGRRTKQPPGVDDSDDFAWLPRLDMCRRLRDSHLAGNCDVGITNIVQIDEPHLRHRIVASQLCRPPERRETLLRYKYTIVIDGNSNAWSSLFCALLSGTCVLLVDSPSNFQQWYYRRLVPWDHYVPVSSNLHDLEDRISWVLARDSEAQAIGQEGQKLAHAMTFEAEVDEAAIKLREWLRTPSSIMFDYRRLDPARSALKIGWLLGHIQDRGDSAALMGDWVGEPGSGKCLEGIQIMLPANIANDALSYRIVLDGGRLSAAVRAGEYLGTRGESTPIHGVAVTVGRTVREFDVECEASFIDGTRLGPVASGVTCEAASGAAMEAFRISILPFQ